MLRTALTTGSGNPAPYLPELKAAGVIVLPVVASVALARRLERAGADAVIAEGSVMAGQVAGLVNDMLPVGEIVRRTVREAGYEPIPLACIRSVNT